MYKVSWLTQIYQTNSKKAVQHFLCLIKHQTIQKHRKSTVSTQIKKITRQKILLKLFNLFIYILKHTSNLNRKRSLGVSKENGTATGIKSDVFIESRFYLDVNIY